MIDKDAGASHDGAQEHHINFQNCTQGPTEAIARGEREGEKKRSDFVKVEGKETNKTKK